MRPRLPATWTGLAFALAGIVILMGIITGEALYPEVYTTHDNEISDLGATRPPDSVWFQPSRGIFNATMIASGVLLGVGGLGVLSLRRSRAAAVAMMAMGVGVFGVGVFPGEHEAIHPLMALTAFVAGGVSAVLAYRVVDGPFRFVSAGLGCVTLVALAFGMFGADTAAFEELGDGGVERWIAYPTVLWMLAFGGYLMAQGADARSKWSSS